MNDELNEALLGERKRSPRIWVSILESLVDKLSHATGNKLEIASFWIGDRDDSGGFGCRVRSRSGLLGTDSDYWEAAISLSSNKEKYWADTEIFLYKNGHALCELGYVSENPQSSGQHLWYQLQEDNWISKGWAFSDGPGEWEWVEEVGDEYPENESVVLNKENYEYGEAIVVCWPAEKLALDKTHRSKKESMYCWISPISIKRGHEKRNLAGSTNIPKVKNNKTTEFTQFTNERLKEFSFDMTRWPISSGWIPGKYHVILRFQHFDHSNTADWLVESEISVPLSFTIS